MSWLWLCRVFLLYCVSVCLRVGVYTLEILQHWSYICNEAAGHLHRSWTFSQIYNNWGPTCSDTVCFVHYASHQGSKYFVWLKWLSRFIFSFQYSSQAMVSTTLRLRGQIFRFTFNLSLRCTVEVRGCEKLVHGRFNTIRRKNMMELSDKTLRPANHERLTSQSKAI